MEFFPHRVPPTRIGTSVSASQANISFFVSNFAATAINTASFALNITGSAGAPGADYTVVGPRGPIGVAGQTGHRGKSVYLLATGWSTGSNTICHTITSIGTSQYFTEPPPNYPGWFCDYNTETTYYADAATLAEGVTVYTDSSCSNEAANLNLSDPGQNKAFETNVYGLIFVGGSHTCATSA